MDHIRILIADDHALFREGLRALLAAFPDIEVVGEADNGEQAITQAESLLPDVVLMDVAMQGIDGIEAARRILRTNPNTGIIIVTMVEDDDSVFAAMRAGARGYVLKGAHHDEMLRAIRAVALGEALFSPGVASRVIGFFASSRKNLPQEAFPDLTSREREILELIARGEANVNIANELSISLKTVRNHVSNIYSKLQVADRAQAMIRARNAGLGRGGT